MPLHLRQATHQDATAIAQVKDALWPEEATAPNYIADVLQQPDHRTIIAIHEDQVVGFVDGFLTLGADGRRRWEVDLLGVHPSHQGHGIGTQLMQAITEVGRGMDAAVARGLVATSNISSQKAFARAEYVVEERPFNLWVTIIANAQSPTANYQLPEAAYLLPVVTLNYQGTWLEGELSVTGLQAAQAICARMGWALVGTLIDVDENALNESAHKLGYLFINHFQWWQRPL